MPSANSISSATTTRWAALAVMTPAPISCNSVIASPTSSNPSIATSPWTSRRPTPISNISAPRRARVTWWGCVTTSTTATPSSWRSIAVNPRRPAPRTRPGIPCSGPSRCSDPGGRARRQNRGSCPRFFYAANIRPVRRACKLRQRLVAELSLRLQHLRQHGEHAVGVERDRFDTFIHEPLRDLGIVRRRLAADADVFAARAAGLDRHLHELQYRAVALVEAGDDAGIAVDAERELSEVIGADGEAVEEVEELVGEQSVSGYLAHHVVLEIAFAACETVFRHRVQHRARLLHAAHEGDHQRDVGKPHGLAHLLHRRAFRRGAGGGAGRRGARGAAGAGRGGRGARRGL